MSSPETTTLFDTDRGFLPRSKPCPASSRRRPRPLSAAAQDVVAEDFKQAYSPIVVAGAVRAIEVVLVATVGFLLYLLTSCRITASAVLISSPLPASR